MIKRFFNTEAAAPQELQDAAKLMACRSAPERYQVLLGLLCAQLSGDVRGYVIRSREGAGYDVAAVHGYGDALKDVGPQYGPWNALELGVTSNPTRAYSANSDAIVESLKSLELFSATGTLSTELTGDSSEAILMLHRHGGPDFGQADSTLVTAWAQVEREAGLLQESNATARRSLLEFSRAFIEAAEAEDFSQLGHAGRVAIYAVELGRALELDDLHLTDLYLAATLHDLGKLGTGSWQDEETHAQRGANMLASAPLLLRATLGIRAHHEHFDGSGFPDRLKGERIPLLGRIIAVADQFDLLSSERGQALPMRDVEKLLIAKGGSELDPELVKTFIGLLRQGKTTQELSEKNTKLLG